jgi:hypothetical protein
MNIFYSGGCNRPIPQADDNEGASQRTQGLSPVDTLFVGSLHGFWAAHREHEP